MASHDMANEAKTRILPMMPMPGLEGKGSNHPQNQAARATDTHCDSPLLQGGLLGISAPEDDRRDRGNEQHRDIDEEKRPDVAMHTPSQYRAAGPAGST